MNNPLFLSVLMVGVLCAQISSAEDTNESARAPSAQCPNTVTKDSLLSVFFDPEVKFAEGCGCYLRRPGAAESDGLLFFGKLGDQRESGWITLRGKLMEVPKEKPAASRVENGKKLLVHSYRSSDITVQVELLHQRSSPEGTGWYSGELTVSSGGCTEKIEVTGICGC